ncbi:reticulon-4-interacting protein 1, mitochondrial isoform X2 [Leptinotarsa decemlineata]|uniref:reticulon-4-interacting protein 1, mitochondrial isoform X2 n=1 Tax=Leptinotarsa decemlineata TaxID=7539 RepID=UPI003D30AA99
MFLGKNFFQGTTRDICFACSGLLIGGIIGLTIGVNLRKRQPVLRYMQAIQCSNYLGPESVTIAEDAFAPYECTDYDVLVNVKAASVQVIDLQICSGYGRTLRRILQQSRSDLPVTLGRDCTGVITDIGSKVTRLEVGDEVWLSVPFWCQGTLCQSMLVCENRVARKPKNIGFEGACSLPYAGSLALSALAEARIEALNARHKRVLVQGGCTPVGCVLIQLLNHWQAEVTATCYQRAVPVVKALGASDMIVLTEMDTPNETTFSEIDRLEQNNAYLKELKTRGDFFDVIIKTGVECDLDNHDLSNFLKTDGTIISTLPPALTSDSYGVFRRLLLSFYINLKYKLQDFLGLPKNNFDETHMCYVTLDRLTEFVEDGYLQTVVDKIYQPHDIEIALHHIQNPHSMGSTVITFR